MTRTRRTTTCDDSPSWTDPGLETVGWVGDAADGLRPADRPDPAADRVRPDRLPRRADASGRRSGRCASAVPRRSGSPRPTARCWAARPRAARGAMRSAAPSARRPPRSGPAGRPPSTCSGRSTGSTAAIDAEPDLDADAMLERVLAEAHAIAAEDKAMCRAIGRFGADLVAPGQGVLTHCNAGGLATADYGTALAVIFTAHEQGKDDPRLRRRDAAPAPGGPADRLGAPAPGRPRAP